MAAATPPGNAGIAGSNFAPPPRSPSVKRIVVEGVDGSGKTTLIKHLMRLYGDLWLIRNEKNDKQDFDTWWFDTLNQQPSKWGSVPIHDRFFYSELVYGPVLRGYVRAMDEVVGRVQRQLREQAFLIYARPGDAVIYRGLESQDQMEGVKVQIDALIDQYDEVMITEEGVYPESRFYTYDWEAKDEPQKVGQAIQRYLYDGRHG